MKVNSDLEIEPDLAESYTISKNGLIYTIKLKPSIFFHDGHPLDAEDVVFTFQTILNPKTNTVRRSNYQINGKNIRFESIDSLTVKISLPEPFSPFLTNLTMGILPKHLLENEDINTSDFNRNPIGTGPFKFVDWRPSQYVKLERNDQYFYKKAKVPGILMKIIPDKNTARISLQKGEIDIEGGVQAKDVKLLEKETHLNLYDYYSLGYTYIGLNLTKEPFNNRQFRLALSHAINRESIVKSVLRGYGKPSILPSSEELWAYPDNTRAINVYGYNPEKSKQLLMEMGYTFNESSGYFEKDGQILSFTLMTNKGNKYREKTAQIVQRFLENVGIKVSIQLMEWSAFIKVMNDTTAFDAIIIGWGLGIDPDGYSIWHSSQFPTGFNYIGYKIQPLIGYSNKADASRLKKTKSHLRKNVSRNHLRYPLLLFISR